MQPAEPTATRVGTRAARAIPPAGLVRTALSLVTSTLVTSVLGLMFWTVAARLYPPGKVGIDSALISAMVTLSSLCQLNLNNAILRFLPQIRRHIGRRIVQAYASATGATLVVGLLFVLVAPIVSSRYRFLSHDHLLTVAFVAALGAWTVFALEDAVLTALRRPTWLPTENGIFSALKLVLLPVALALLGSRSHAVFLAWVIPMWLTVPAVNWLIARRVLPKARVAQRNAPGVLERIARRDLAAFLGQDLIGNALFQATAAAIPLIVVAMLGPVANAYFFIPYTLITTFDLLFLGVATSVTAEGARDERQVGQLAASVMRRFLPFQIPVVVLIIVLAPLLLRLFGPGYVQHGVTTLRLLAAASCFRSILFIFGSVARVQRRGMALVAVEAGTSVLLTGLTVLIAPRWGAEGVATVWLVVHAALAAVVLPTILRVARPAATAE